MSLKNFMSYDDASTVLGEYADKVNELKSGLTNVDVALDVPEGTGKNLFNSTLNSYSVNGVTITNNNDGTYRLSGTATSTVWGEPIGSVKLKAGTYKLVGWNPNTPGRKNSVMIYIYDHTSINDYGQGGTTFTLEEETTYSVNFVINNGTTIDTVIKPMITEDINATYSDFAPYIPSVESRIEAVESGLLDITITDNAHLGQYDLSSYTSDSNQYTAPSEGWVYIKNESGKNCIAHIYNDNMTIGGAEGRFVIPVKKGCKIYVEGSATAVVFKVG